MGVVSRLKKKGIIRDDELEKDKKKREEALKRNQEELPKASKIREELKTSKKTKREEDSDNWFQERNKGKTLKRVESTNRLPKAEKKEITKTIFEIGLNTIKNDQNLRNALNTTKNLGSSAYTGIMQFGKTLNERMVDNRNLRINLTNSDIERLQRYGENEKAEAISKGQANLFGLKQNKDTGKLEKIKYEDENKELQKKIDKENEKMAKRVEDSTGFGKTTAEFASSLGNNLVGIGTSLVNPMLGVTYFVGSATGSYEDDARERGMEGDKAKLYARIMGGVEGTLDYVFNFGSLQSGFKAIGKESAEKIISKFGTSMLGNGIENAVQEGITEPINELIAGMAGGKDKANWENIGQRVYKSALYGFASGLIFDGIGRGLGSISNIQNKINNGEELSPTDLQNVVQELEASGMRREEIFEASKNNALEAVNAEAQRIKEEQQTEVNQIQDTEPLPVANKQNTNSNRLRELAIEEINNSNASQKEKNDALDILNQMEEVTSQDVEDIRNFMSNVAELETEASKLKTDGNYKYDQTRRKKYMEYKNDNTPYNSKVVDEVLDTIPQNRNGRRTVKQWLQAADEIGNRISDLSNEEIEEIAYKSWFELQPTKNITQYDRTTKSSVGFQKLTSDEWINTINKAVNEARENNRVETESIQQDKKIQGLEDYNIEELKEGFKNDIKQILENNDLYDIDIVDIDLHGSRLRGTAKNNSDLDVVVQYNGDIREDDLFNILNENPLEIEGIKVDINPIQENIKSYMERSSEYDQKIKQASKIENQEKSVDTENKSDSQVRQEVFDYLKNNNINMSADEFIEWASNKQLEQEDNMTPQQQELYSLINDIQNRTSEKLEKSNKIEYNKTNLDLSEAKPGDLKNQFYKALTPKQWAKYHKKMNSVMDTTYGYFDRTDVIDGKVVTTQLIDGNEQVTSVLKIKKNPQGLISFVKELSEKYGYNGAEVENSLREMYGEENVFRYDTSSNKFIPSTTNTDITDRGINTTNTTNERITTKKENITTNKGEIESQQGSFNLSQDNQGRTLTKEQQEYFKDSKVRDENGNLLEVYHGTPNGGFNIFDMNFRGITTDITSTGDYGKGFYFTPNIEMAKGYSENDTYNKGNKQVYKVYLNMKNPLRLDLLNKISKDGRELIKKYGWHNTTDEMYDKIYAKYGLTREEFGKMDEAQTMLGDNWQDIELSELGFDGIINENQNEYIVFNPNQIKNVDNLKPTDNPDIRYELEDTSNNTAENEIQRKINRSMTMQEAKDMVQRAFVTGNIYDWYEGKYKNGDEWLAGEGADEVALYIDNDYNLQQKYINSNEDILNEEYMIEDVIESYQNGTLTGNSDKLTTRLDTSKNTGYTDKRFYSPREIKGGKELYEIANQRVTNKNRKDVYKARADFIINAHNKGYTESLGLTQKEVNQKLKNWANYPKKAMDISNSINEGVATENRWAGIENSSIVNELSVSKEQLNSLVKEIKGITNDYQRRYITNTMLAIDTHMDYSGLTYDFSPDVRSMSTSALADYSSDTDTIRVRREGQNTIAHETGHFIDHLLGRKIGDGYNLGLTSLCREYKHRNLTGEQKQFLSNFNNFLQSIEDVSDIGSTYKMSSNEVFARFVARFTEWTRNVATNNRYGYEEKWYNDNFTQSQYREFAKLLQEYSLLETTGQVSSKIDRTKSKKFDQRIDDIYSELFKTEPSDNILATSEYTKNKTMNPTEIANTNKESMITTPKLEEKNYKIGNKQSSFISNILNDAQFLDKDLRQEMAKEENIRYYSGITNAETLEKAYNSLKKGGEKETLSWFNKEEKNISAEDVTKGWILLKQYQDAGDYQGAVQVAKKMRQMGTKAGQAVQAYNIMARMSPEGMFYYAQAELDEAYNKMVEGKSKEWIEKNQDKFTLSPEETQTIIDTMKEVSELEDGREKTVKLAQIQKLVSDKIPPSSGQSIKAWLRISMLFNPKTQVRNVMGNTVVLPVNATADIFSGAMDKLISKKTGVRTTGITKEGIKGYGQGFKKGLFESYDDFRKGIDTRNVEGNRFEIGEGNSFKDKGLGKALNRVDNLLTFALDAGDRGFYEASFTNSINNQLVLNNTTEVTQDMIDIATQEALQRTWQDNNAYTQTVLNIRKDLNKINVKGYGLGDVLIPFAKTPANLTKAIVDYSPVGLAKTLTLDAKKFNNSLSNGQYTAQLQHNFVQNLGKGMAGSLLYVLGYGLAKAGIATGESDDDKDVKNFMKNSLGIGSYSIKVGDKSYSYDWAQPVATSLAIMTNYVKYSKDNPDANMIEKAIKSLDIGSEQLLQQSFMESINTVLNGSGTTMENLSKAILDLPARAIPTFSKQIADMVDGTQRTSFEYGKPVQSAKNAVLSKIPLASKTLPTSVDTLGNEIKKYGGNNNIWNVMFNPANTNRGQLSKAGEEIYNIYMQTGDTTIFPRTAPYYINSKGEKVNMTAEERSKFQKVSGKYVEETLGSLLNDSNYKKLSTERKASIINEIVSDSFSKAKYDVLKIDTEAYAKKRETFKDIKPSTYYDFKFKTDNIQKDSEKVSVLLKSNYSQKEKMAIYEKTILSKQDEKYPIIKKMFTDKGLNIDNYLKYKEDCPTMGVKKDKVVKYVNKMNIPYNQKLLLLGTRYKLSSKDRNTLGNFIYDSDKLTSDEKLKLYGKLKGFKVYKNGDIAW